MCGRDFTLGGIRRPGVSTAQPRRCSLCTTRGPIWMMIGCSLIWDFLLVYIYRPQTKFAKVMFSQVSVCRRGGGCLPHIPWADTPWADTPWADTPKADTPTGKHPPGRHPRQYFLGYGQQASSTHPTGMHSCSWSYCLNYYLCSCHHSKMEH